DCERLNVIWRDRIDGRLDEIFDFQDKVSMAIVKKITPSVQEAEKARVARKRPETFSAYDYFLRGLDLVYRLDRDRFDNARAMFERAKELDPRYAAPHAYLALWYAIRIGQGWSPDKKADAEAAAGLKAAAIECDRLDASVLAICGHVESILLKNHEGAIALFDRAIAAAPNSAIAWTRSSPTYSYIGNWKEGRRRAELGRDLSPLDRHVFYSYTALSLAAYTGEEYDEAIYWGRRAREENSFFTATLRLLCASQAAAGQIEHAQKTASNLLGLEPNFRVEAFCREYAYKEQGQRDRLAAHLLAAGLPN
ncbi:unnamed protein product, partial [Phaeothamnion confervicola]